MSAKWTPEVLDAAIGVLGRHTTSVAAAAEMGITIAALRNGFLRAGRGAVGQYLIPTRGPTFGGTAPVVAPAPTDVEIPVYFDEPEADRAHVDRGPPPDRYEGLTIRCSGEEEAHLYFPDCHHPFADTRAFALAVKAGHRLRQRFKRLRIITLGDFADFASVSSHDKDPRRLSQLAGEIKVTNDALDQIDAIGADWTHFIEGNHCHRLARYLTRSAPALLDSLSVPELLKLKARGWAFTPYRSHLRVGKLAATHDIGVAGAYALFRAGSAFEQTIITGHTHRAGAHYFGNSNGTHVAASFGWLGSAAEIDYMYRIRVVRDWSLGFGTGIMEPNGTVHLHPVPIVDYRAAVMGEMISG